MPLNPSASFPLEVTSTGGGGNSLTRKNDSTWQEQCSDSEWRVSTHIEAPDPPLTIHIKCPIRTYKLMPENSCLTHTYIQTQMSSVLVNAYLQESQVRLHLWYLHGLNIPSTRKFKLPTWCYQTQSWFSQASMNQFQWSSHPSIWIWNPHNPLTLWVGSSTLTSVMEAKDITRVRVCVCKYIRIGHTCTFLHSAW